MASKAASLPPCIQLPLEEETLNDVVAKAKDWAIMHGAAMRSKTDFSLDSVVFAPFTLLPSCVPEDQFKHAVKVQVTMNTLFHRVAHDHEFLSSSLKSTIEVDSFTRRLYDIYETVRQKGVRQPITLGLMRNDIMLEFQNGCRQEEVESGIDGRFSFIQIEFNTISAGFGWLGPVSSEIHRYVLGELGHGDKADHLPANNALTGLCEGIVEAWKLFNNDKAVVLFVVEDVSYNICDQRFMEFEVRKLAPTATVIRRNLQELSQQATLLPDRTLLVGDYVVAVVYYRSGYDPSQYTTDDCWKIRLDIELSSAIKCPSIQYHLAGTKKVQQVLATPGVVEKFLSEPSDVAAVRGMFTEIYSLDLTPEGDKAVELVMKEPEGFVLKPQREGGGNNIYGHDIPKVLQEQKELRKSWILMRRIRPPVQPNYIIRPSSDSPPQLTNVVSELGVFGVIIGDSENIIVNRSVGHMLRTKQSDVNEGGVAAGLGSLDSPYLI